MKIEVSEELDADPESVFAFVADFSNNPRWQSGVEEARKTSDGELGVGTTFEQVSSFLGRRIESSFEVTAFQDGERIRYESTAGTFPIRITRSVEGGPDGTLVVATIEGEPGGLFSVAAPVLRRITERRIQSDYAVLKTLLESDDQRE